jgi:Putative phage serine protease XkdF
MDAYSGTVLKARAEDRFLLLVAYSANKMPFRGADGFVDLACPEVLEKACWRFMDNGAQVGLWHQEGHEKAARIVENYIYRNPVPWVLEAPNGTHQVIKEGDWVTGLILSKKTWKLYKAGLIGGASPQGGAARRYASPETLARVRSA